MRIYIQCACLHVKDTCASEMLHSTYVCTCTCTSDHHHITCIWILQVMGGDIAYRKLIKIRLLYISPVSYLGREFHGVYVTVFCHGKMLANAYHFIR